MSVRLTLSGFDKYLDELRKAGANVQKVTEDTLLESAEIFKKELVKNVNASPMSNDTKDRMNEDMIEPRIIHSSDQIVVAETGYKMGDYNPKDLSGGFIAQFNEYGTVRRKTRKGANRGSLEELEFTRRAHKASNPKIKKLQKSILTEALKGLKT